ncbi:nitrate reductase, delta subunit [Actinomyces sp. Chiba101]|uniref:nitrate reductase molybdenum cofactor assembly chaperone n=1 Tax=Actinomyces TaxID=1654 RepID=UPI000974E3F7|nr:MULTISPECIES: nitrate reductase molybdenum cofactor assembly chaperone [Actinomyces]BAW93730.1 nitrate reductase, delta subunit [Actinomyces sp. Chiba101]GAV93411.1 nitrate reductase, delta subunit [Actinomyces denticolens]SUU74685.1 Nitrate reductase-like protein narX [Actinomyces denticolens]
MSAPGALFVRPPLALEPLEAVEMTASQRAAVHMCASLLLDYPSEGELGRRLDAVEEALAGVPSPVRERLAGFVADARERGERALAEHYVDVFDRRRRCCLYLTYYAVGDTRQRGAALVAFKQALAASGYEMAGDELPDYLPVVLEFSARSAERGDEIAGALLASHREGIEVLRSALTDIGSPYAGLVEAVCMTLAPLDEPTAERIRRLVAAGPPTETVGVTEVLPFPSVPVSMPVSMPLAGPFQQFQSEAVLGVAPVQE